MKKYLSLLVLCGAFLAVADEDEPKPQEETDSKSVAVDDSEVAKEKRSPIKTRIIKLNHANAVDVAQKFNTMWSGEFGQVWKVSKMAVAFEESNTLMLTAPEPILEACEESIKELDVDAQQVYIEARFVELGNTASHKVGIDWSMLNGMSGTANLGGGIQQYTVGKGVESYIKRAVSAEYPTEEFNVKGNNGSSDASISYFNGTLNFSQMALTLKALDATEDARTFSNPKIIVSSGKKATVDMTTKYPNVNIAVKRTFNTTGDSTDLDMKMADIPGEDKFMFAKEAFFSWGIQLDVTPRVGTNGLINVSIVPTISQLDTSYGEGGFVTSGNDSSSSDDSTISSKYPIIEMKRLITEFDMASGSTAVIGGLSVTEETQVDNGIPVLRTIPWIGPRLFGSMERVKTQKEIIVFVTVGLVNPREMVKDAGLPKNAVLGRQFVEGKKLEPGDRPQKNLEGIESLDMRPLEEQAKDPLAVQTPVSHEWKFPAFFQKDANFKKEGDQK